MYIYIYVYIYIYIERERDNVMHNDDRILLTILLISAWVAVLSCC